MLIAPTAATPTLVTMKEIHSPLVAGAVLLFNPARKKATSADINVTTYMLRIFILVDILLLAPFKLLAA